MPMASTEYVNSGGGMPMGGYGGWGGDWMGMLLVIALLGGRRGFGFGGGDDCGFVGHRGDCCEKEVRMHDAHVDSRFNAMQSQMDFNNVEQGQQRILNAINDGHYRHYDGINGLRAEVGRLGFDNAIIAKNAEIAALQCCCETQRAIDGVKFNDERNAWQISKQISDCCCETNRNLDSVKVEIANGFCQTNFNGERNTNAIVGAINAGNQRVIDWLACNELKEANAEIARLNADKNKLEIIAAMKPVAPVPAYIQANPFENFTPRVHCVPQPQCNPCGGMF